MQGSVEGTLGNSSGSYLEMTSYQPSHTFPHWLPHHCWGRHRIVEPPRFHR